MNVPMRGGAGPAGVRMRGLRLLPRDALIKTNELDEGDWNYQPILGYVQRKRFDLAARYLVGARYGRLLEVGYGSGIFMPHLAQHCDELAGVDRHDCHEQVTQQLAKHGVHAELHSSDVTALPFPDDAFDCAVSISVIEFVPDLAAACREIARVLRPDGHFILVTPAKSLVSDVGLKLLTGNSADDAYGTKREAVLPTLLDTFTLLKNRPFPPLGGGFVRLYNALKLQPRG